MKNSAQTPLPQRIFLVAARFFNAVWNPKLA